MPSDLIRFVPVAAKSFLTSKTIGANIVAFVATWLGAHHLPIDADTQATLVAGVMALMNIALRAVTVQPISLTLPGKSTPDAGGKPA